MEWLSAINFPDLSGWGAFLALAAFNVTAFIREWIYPAGVADRFERAWQSEREARVSLEESKHPAVLSAMEANTNVVLTLQKTLEELLADQDQP